MNELEKFQKRKTRIERFEQERGRKEGALGQIIDQIKKEFDCPSIEAGQAKLKEMIDGQKENKRKFRRKFTTFDRVYQEFLKKIQVED